MVYVADVETYELVCMNQKLRNSVGIRDDGQYVGRKCYELLQRTDNLCEFCTNCRLQNGEFLTWTHLNPILNKRVLLKDTLIEENWKNIGLNLPLTLILRTAVSCHIFMRTVRPF